MDKSAIFLLIVTLANVMIVANAACADRLDANSSNSTSDSTVDKMSNFFMEVGCTIKSGAEKVKEKFESGYNYIKSKVTPDEFKNATQSDVKPMNDGSLPQDDRITFKDNPEDALNGNESSPPESSPTEANTVVGATDVTITYPDVTAIVVEDRTALDAPEMCSQGEVKTKGKCRKEIIL